MKREQAPAMKTKMIYLNVNELDNILAKHFGAWSCCVENVTAGRRGYINTSRVEVSGICDLDIKLTYLLETDDAPVKSNDQTSEPKTD